MVVSHPNPTAESIDVKVQVHEKKGCRVELEVKAPVHMINMARKNAIKLVSKEVSLPGFRKGKAPDEIILKQFSGEVERKMHKTLADLAFIAAQKVVKVPVLNNNSPISFDLKKLAPEEGAELMFSFETEPRIPSVNFTQFTPKEVKRAEVKDKQIDEAVLQMRFFYAKWNSVTSRPIQDGDYVMIDLDTVEGEHIERVFHHIRFEVSKERMAGWMKKLIQGAKAGDVLEGVSQADDTATDAEKAEFKPKNVRITILKVEEAELPALDDEFAKKVGAADVAHMRQSIADLLNKQADEKVQSELREQVNDYLIEAYPFELPHSLIDTEKKHRMNQLMHDPSFKDKWNKMSQEERKKLDEKLTAEATQAVSLFYLSRDIVQKEKIPVTHQEVQQEAIKTYQSHGGRQIDQMPKEIFALALSKVILAKAQDLFLKKT